MINALETIKNNANTAIIVGIFTIVGAMSGAAIKGYYDKAGIDEQVEAEIRLLSAKHAFQNAGEIRRRMEQYLVTLHELISLLGKSTKTDKVQSKIDQLKAIAQGLLIYGGPDLGAACMQANLAIERAYGAKNSTELKEASTTIRDAFEKLYPSYLAVMKVYESHTMPGIQEENLRRQFVNQFLRGFTDEWNR